MPCYKTSCLKYDTTFDDFMHVNNKKTFTYLKDKGIYPT